MSEENLLSEFATEAEYLDNDPDNGDEAQTLEEMLASKQEYIDWLQDSLISLSKSLRSLIEEFDSDDYGPYISKAVVLDKLEELWEET